MKLRGFDTWQEAEASSRARFEEATSQAANVDEAREELAQAVHRCSQLEAELAQRPTQSQVRLEDCTVRSVV